MAMRKSRSMVSLSRVAPPSQPMEDTETAILIAHNPHAADSRSRTRMPGAFVRCSRRRCGCCPPTAYAYAAHLCSVGCCCVVTHEMFRNQNTFRSEQWQLDVMLQFLLTACIPMHQDCVAYVPGAGACTRGLLATGMMISMASFQYLYSQMWMWWSVVGLLLFLVRLCCAPFTRRARRHRSPLVDAPTSMLYWVVVVGALVWQGDRLWDGNDIEAGIANRFESICFIWLLLCTHPRSIDTSWHWVERMWRWGIMGTAITLIWDGRAYSPLPSPH